MKRQLHSLLVRRERILAADETPGNRPAISVVPP